MYTQHKTEQHIVGPVSSTPTRINQKIWCYRNGFVRIPHGVRVSSDQGQPCDSPKRNERYQRQGQRHLTRAFAGSKPLPVLLASSLDPILGDGCLRQVLRRLSDSVALCWTLLIWGLLLCQFANEHGGM
ncbi:hypothetical protein BDR07DRAFT_587993 [Suillus spraguei]|nr:hypothetical protein BDR07DRAFT_587993 [Suillus spraguei]